MKAKEYFAEYGEKMKGLRIASDNDTEWQKMMCQLLQDFMDEQSELIKSRKVVKEKAMVAIIEEMNDKWNKLHDIFIMQQGACPFIYNGWRLFMIAKLEDRGVDYGRIKGQR